MSHLRETAEGDNKLMGILLMIAIGAMGLGGISMLILTIKWVNSPPTIHHETNVTIDDRDTNTTTTNQKTDCGWLSWGCKGD